LLPDTMVVARVKIDKPEKQRRHYCINTEQDVGYRLT
jgi:hypothetical protein